MTFKTVLLGSLAGVALSGTAEASPFHNWYISLEGGANWVQDWDFRSRTTFSTIQGRQTFFSSNRAEVNFNTGWAILGAVGYDFGHWRVELEGGYRRNDVDHVDVRHFETGEVITPGLTVHSRFEGFDADLSEWSIMVNAYYDFYLSNHLFGTIGAGIGGDHVDFDVGHFGGGEEGLFAENFSDWEFAWQIIAGFGYELSPNWDLTLNYRFFQVESPDLNVGPLEDNFFVDNDGHFNKHTVTLGLRYTFGQPELPPPPPPAAPPPPPPPPPAHFIIFFGWNKCNITAEADRVLGEAAQTAKTQGSASISIVGHTDTSGSTAYNQKLSECRANAAATNLEGKGIPRSAMTTEGRGETELMVQTGDGVKEPQNRRATIDLH